MCGVGGGAAGLFKGVAHLERCHCARGGMIREINVSLHRAINSDLIRLLSRGCLRRGTEKGEGARRSQCLYTF